MNATNYCAEYIEATKKTPNFSHSLREPNLVNVHRAVKFRLPDDGLLFGETINISIDFDLLSKKFAKYIGVVKLPYDSVALEFPYTVNHKELLIKSKAILLAENIGDKIVFSCVVIIPTNKQTILAEDRFIITIDSDLSIEMLSGKDDKRIATLSDQARAHHFCNVILGFIAALECSNTVTVDRPASNMLNKKRINKGKQPFFSYKILTIDTKRDSSKSKIGNSSHNSPRVHLRRGHIRRLENKTVWVNPCVVGDKSKGMVTKDYRVI